MKSLAAYVSESESENDHNSPVSTKTACNIGRPVGSKNCIYNFCSTYENLEEAKEVVKLEGVWRYKKDQLSRSNKSGWHKKLFYQCKFVSSTIKMKNQKHSSIPERDMLDEPFVLSYSCFFEDEYNLDYEEGDIFIITLLSL
jgi:hypothetical protein